MNRIIGYLKPYTAKMTQGLVIKFVGTVMDLALPWVLAYLIDTVAPQENIPMVYFWGVVMLVCSVLAVLANIIANRMAAIVARDATRIIRHDLFNKMMGLSLNQIDKFTMPSLISRLTSDTYNIHRTIGMMQRMGVRAPILLLGGVTVTMMLDARLSLVLIATLPLITVAVVLISRKGMPLFTAVQEAGDRMVRTVRDGVMGIRVIKALSKGAYEADRFRFHNADMAKKETKASLVMGVTNPVMNIFLNGGLAAVILTGAYLVNNGTTEPGKIIAFMSYFLIILNAMLMVNRLFVMFTQAAASAKRIAEVLDTLPDLQTEPSTAIREDKHIVFDRVCFAYSGKEEALSDISFSLNRGETLGIIGETGSGKTTLIHLLQRLYDVSGGQIRIEGENIKSIPPGRLRQMFGVAFQSDAFFADTILENVELGRNLPASQVENALRCAQAWDFVMEKPGGLQYKLTAKAMNLSGGQKQRILIARALAGNPSILILDDSSSALDYETDARMRTAIRTYFKETTVILVAHRISSVMNAESILVLEDGRVAGLGNDTHLMETCVVYRETAQVQMGGYLA